MKIATSGRGFRSAFRSLASAGLVAYCGCSCIPGLSAQEPEVRLVEAGDAVRRVRPFPPGESATTIRGHLWQMLDTSWLAETPSPGYRTYQASSYDRLSVEPGNDAWFANRDIGQFVAVERRNGKREHVMLEADGPGAVVRIWSANPVGNLRIYIDGAETPIELPMEEIMKGDHPLFPEPLAGVRGRGYNLYFPIPYREKIRIANDRGTFYYHVDYRAYDAGTEVESFSVERLEEMKGEIATIAAALASARQPPASLAAEPAPGPAVEVAPGASATLWETDGEGAIDLMRVRIVADDAAKALRGTVLSIAFDGDEPSVVCPVGDFFGTAPGINPYSTLPLGVAADGTLHSRWVMPYTKGARVSIENRSGAPLAAEIDVRAVALDPPIPPDRALRFHAGYRTGLGMETRPFRDYRMIAIEGEGVFAGASMAIANPTRKWWGEGDEKIYVDGETFPSHFGTGTEDYFGYAWCDTAIFDHAFHSQSRCDGPVNFGHTAVNRFHFLDAIPFRDDFRFDMEVWHWDTGVKVDYATVAYWYARPGSTSDAMRDIDDASLAIPVLPELKIRKVEGALEAETLPREATGKTKLIVQDMAEFGDGWSHGVQVWMRDGQPGDRVEFKFDAPGGGTYEVFAGFTLAPDYAIASVEVEGGEGLPLLDLYAAEPTPSPERSLGRHALKERGNVLTMTIVGANPEAAKEYMMGLDYVRLAKVE